MRESVVTVSSSPDSPENLLTGNGSFFKKKTTKKQRTDFCMIVQELVYDSPGTYVNRKITLSSVDVGAPRYFFSLFFFIFFKNLKKYDFTHTLKVSHCVHVV
jgi:hypothetical protein